MLTYDIDFRIQYYLDLITNQSGIYVVYRGCPFERMPDLINFKELLYIGQTLNLYQRIHQHIDNNDFSDFISIGEMLYVTCAKVDMVSLDSVENALIYMQQPKLNLKLKNDYLHTMPVEYHLKGACQLFRIHNFKIQKPHPLSKAIIIKQ